MSNKPDLKSVLCNHLLNSLFNGNIKTVHKIVILNLVLLKTDSEIATHRELDSQEWVIIIH